MTRDRPRFKTMKAAISRYAKNEPIVSRNSQYARAAIIAIATVFVYLNSFSGVFLFDDDSAIVNNVAVHDLWSFHWFSLRGRPVSTLTIAINYSIGGVDPIGYHVFNVAIHIINGLLLYGVVSEVVKHWGTSSGKPSSHFAFCAALLWAVHPLCTQSVTYTIQRSEALAAMGMLATLFCWSKAARKCSPTYSPVPFGNASLIRRLTRGGSPGWSMAAMLAAIIAYGSKESAAMLPIILLLFDRIFLSQSWRAMKDRSVWHAAIGLPVAVGVIVYATAFLSGQQQDQTVGFSIGRITPLTYFASQPFVFAKYLWLSVFPIHQSLDYGWLPSQNHFAIGFGLLLWMAIILAANWLIRSKPPIGFIAWASLLILAPSSSVMPLQDIIFEHRVYLPLAGVCILFVGAWDRLGAVASNRFGSTADGWKIAVGIAIVIALGALTIIRNREYSSAERMFAADVSRNPENPRALANLAAARNFDYPDDCIAMYKQALELYQSREFFYAGTRYKLTRAIGDIYFLTGRPHEAAIYLSEALESANDAVQEAEVHFSLAMIASAGGQVKEADQHFELAIDKASTLPSLREAFAVHLQRTGRGQPAAEAIKGDSRRP